MDLDFHSQDRDLPIKVAKSKKLLSKRYKQKFVLIYVADNFFSYILCRWDGNRNGFRAFVYYLLHIIWKAKASLFQLVDTIT